MEAQATTEAYADVRAKLNAHAAGRLVLSAALSTSLDVFEPAGIFVADSLAFVAGAVADYLGSSWQRVM